jgi:heat shock protein 4
LVSHTNALLQDWLYEEGEDTIKSVYVAKMDDIRFIAGPIIQRYKEKVEAERDAVRKAEEEAAAKRRAELEAKKAEEEAAKKSTEGDAEMKDAPAEGEAQGETEEKQ